MITTGVLFVWALNTTVDVNVAGFVVVDEVVDDRVRADDVGVRIVDNDVAVVAHVGGAAYGIDMDVLVANVAVHVDAVLSAIVLLMLVLSMMMIILIMLLWLFVSMWLLITMLVPMLLLLMLLMWLLVLLLMLPLLLMSLTLMQLLLLLFSC